MKHQPFTLRSSILKAILLASAAALFASCATDPDAPEKPRTRQVEHPNPMGGPSRFTTEPDNSAPR